MALQSRSQSGLVLITILVSLTLTGLTVWSVWRQGRALQDRRWADLANDAGRMAARREALWRSELQRSFDALQRAEQVEDTEQVDAWAAEQARWLLTAVEADDGRWQLYPQTILNAQLPTEQYDLGATLRHYRDLQTYADTVTRVDNLLSSAASEAQVGRPLAAARLFGDAARLLRDTPRFEPIALQADMQRIEALLAAADYERALTALRELVPPLQDAHFSRLGDPEAAALQTFATELGVPPDDTLAQELDRLVELGQRRAQAADVTRRLLTEQLDASRSADELTFVRGRSEAGDRFLVVVRDISPRRRAALVVPADEVFERYWGTVDEERFRLARRPHAAPVLARLGAPFADAVLVPTPETAAEFQATERRRWATVLATSLGSLGGWALVILMMIRAVNRQRELAGLQRRFLADVSHELKTPLALIRLLAETLVQGRLRDPNRVQDYHETIIREAERLTNLLENILDMGRIESGRKRYTFGTCDVAQVARQAWTLFEPQFQKEGFETELELGPDLPTIRADAAALQQVLVNLLQNAHRYSTEKKFVRLSVEQQGHLIVFTVEDRGIGMSRNQLNRLGESFFRAEDTRVRQTRGTGLGLAIVNHIVTAHSGKIEVQSRPGQGSRFVIWIPCDLED